MGDRPERPVFLDAREHPPPTGRKLVLLTQERTCVVGKWQAGMIGWMELPRIPDSLKWEAK